MKQLSPVLTRLLDGKNFKITLVRIFLLVAVVYLSIKFVVQPVRCDGISMEPNYHDRSIHLVYKLAYKTADSLQRGDVVAITISGEKVLLMKRVIGLPGERVRIQNGIVQINDQPLEEPWMEDVPRAPWNRSEIQLREDEFLVIGDNRTMPMRYHVFGEVNFHRILGKVVK